MTKNYVRFIGLCAGRERRRRFFVSLFSQIPFVVAAAVVVAVVAVVAACRRLLSQTTIQADSKK